MINPLKYAGKSILDVKGKQLLKRSWTFNMLDPYLSKTLIRWIRYSTPTTRTRSLDYKGLQQTITNTNYQIKAHRKYTPTSLFTIIVIFYNFLWNEFNICPRIILHTLRNFHIVRSFWNRFLRKEYVVVTSYFTTLLIKQVLAKVQTHFRSDR